MKTMFPTLLFFLLISISCEKDAEILPKFYPYIVTADASVTSSGVTFSADLLQPGDQKITRYGFVWSDEGTPTLQHDSKLFSGDAKKGTYSCTLTGGFVKGNSYAVRAVVITEQGMVYGNIKNFTSLGSLPPQITRFTPGCGPIGTRVILEGKNFAVSKPGNIVKFGNIRAVVDSLSDDRLFVTVPAVVESIKAPILVEAGEMTAISSDSFSIWFPWKRMKDFDEGYNGLISFSIGDKGYVGLGYGKTEFWEYDPATELFTRKSGFPETINGYPAAFAINDKGYVIFSSGKYQYSGADTITQLWEYDPARDQWTRKAVFPGTSRNSAVALSIGGKGYFGTGQYNDTYGNLHYLGDFWEYDPVSDSWTKKKDFPGGERALAFGFSIGTNGYLGTGGTGWWDKKIYRYDPANNTWAYMGDYPGEGYIHINGFVIDNKGYFGLGGNSSGDSYADFWEFDPSGNSWKQMRSCPAGMDATLGFTINNKGYIGIGLQDYMDYDDSRHIIYEFDPAKN